MDGRQQYDEAFISALGVEASALGASFTFKDVDRWDSVAHLLLITELEDVFDVMFEPDDIIHFGSYLNGIEILKKYGVEL